MLFPGLDLSGIIPNSISALHICAVCRYIFTSYKPFNAFFATGSVIVIVGVAVTFSFENIAVPRASLFSVRRGLDWPRGFPLRTRTPPARVNVVVGFSPFNLLQVSIHQNNFGVFIGFLTGIHYRVDGFARGAGAHCTRPFRYAADRYGDRGVHGIVVELELRADDLEVRRGPGDTLDYGRLRKSPRYSIAGTRHLANRRNREFRRVCSPLVVTTDRTYRTPSVSRSVR